MGALGAQTRFIWLLHLSTLVFRAIFRSMPLMAGKAFHAIFPVSQQQDQSARNRGRMLLAVGEQMPGIQGADKKKSGAQGSESQGKGAAMAHIALAEGEPAHAEQDHRQSKMKTMGMGFLWKEVYSPELQGRKNQGQGGAMG